MGDHTPTTVPGDGEARDQTLSPGLVSVATWILWAAAGVFLAVAALALWAGSHAVRLDQGVAFIALPLLAAAGLVVVSRGKPEARVGIAVLLGVTAVALFGADVMAAAALEAAKDQNTPSSDGISVMEITTRLREQGVVAYPTIPGNMLVDGNVGFLIADRLTHPISSAPGGVTAVMCDEWPGGIEYLADRFGFNNPDSVWSATNVDVVLLGDSYTQGLCVPAPDQIATRLSAQQGTILNLGVRGTGPLQQLAILREYGSTMTPPVVVWLFYEGNDLYDLSRASQRGWLTAYLDPAHSQGLPARQRALDEQYGAWIDSVLAAGPPPPSSSGSNLALIRQSLTLSTLRRLVGFGVIFPSRKSPIGIYPSVLKQGLGDVRTWDGSLILAYLPSYGRYRTVIGEGVPGKREILESARMLGIPVVDLDVAFRSHGDPRSLWAHPRGHLNEDGYALVVAEIGRAIERLN